MIVVKRQRGPQTGTKIRSKNSNYAINQFNFKDDIMAALQKRKSLQRTVEGFGGRERIRTAVAGFADLCLATRLRDREDGKCSKKSFLYKYKVKK